MLSSQVRLSSGVLAYDRARLYCRSSSISGSFSCSRIWAVAIKTVRILIVRPFTSDGNVVVWGDISISCYKNRSKNTCSFGKLIIIVGVMACSQVTWLTTFTRMPCRPYCVLLTKQNMVCRAGMERVMNTTCVPHQPRSIPTTLGFALRSSFRIERGVMTPR